jgi:hypothetical protein
MNITFSLCAAHRPRGGFGSRLFSPLARPVVDARDSVDVLEARLAEQLAAGIVRRRFDVPQLALVSLDLLHEFPFRTFIKLPLVHD